MPLCYGIFVSYFKKENIINYPGSAVSITGVIDDYKEERISSNRYRIRVTKYEDQAIEETTRFLIVTNPYTEYVYGQELLLYGEIELPKDFITDTGKTFDYDSYLKLSHVYGIMRDPEIKILNDFRGNHVKRFLFKTRESFSNSIENKLPLADATLAKGILLGEKGGITNTMHENLARSSTSHIIALSGYNITIVSEIILKIFQGLTIAVKSFLGLASIIFFIIMTGGGSSVVRAGIMASVLLYARSRGKKYNALYALMLATAMLVLISPLAIRYDMGFHLSVLATFGLIVFQSSIAGYLIKKRFYKWLAETMASTLSATIMTMPYIAYNMGIVSILGIFANLIVVPLIPPLMLFSFLTAISPHIISLPFVFVTKNISTIILETINKIGSIKFAAVNTPNINLIFIILVYLILFYIAFKLFKKDS